MAKSKKPCCLPNHELHGRFLALIEQMEAEKHCNIAILGALEMAKQSYAFNTSISIYQDRQHSIHNQ